MKVYIVSDEQWDGGCSWRAIQKVFLDKSKAKKYVEKEAKKYSLINYELEEHEVIE